MSYDGTTPGAAQPPMMTGEQSQLLRAMALRMMNQKPEHMQSWLQVLAQMANGALMGQYMNRANQGDYSRMNSGRPPGVAPPAAQPPPANPPPTVPQYTTDNLDQTAVD